MDSTWNRRKFRRVNVRIPAQVHFKSQVVSAEIVNLSEGGVFLECPHTIGLGEEVRVSILFKEATFLDGRVVELSIGEIPETNPEMMVVRWLRSESVEEKPGFGVEFANLDDLKKDFLLRLMRYYDLLNKAGVNF